MGLRIGIGFGLGPVRISASAPLITNRRRRRPTYVFVPQPQPLPPRPARHFPSPKARKVFGIIVAIPVTAFLLLLQWAMFAANGFSVGMIWLLFQLAVISIPLSIWWYPRHARRRSERANMAARADYEHNAMMNGDTTTGVFGGYQPYI
jgi:hypothetical protein